MYFEYFKFHFDYEYVLMYLQFITLFELHNLTVTQIF